MKEKYHKKCGGRFLLEEIWKPMGWALVRVDENGQAMHTWECPRCGETILYPKEELVGFDELVGTDEAEAGEDAGKCAACGYWDVDGLGICNNCGYRNRRAGEDIVYKGFSEEAKAKTFHVEINHADNPGDNESFMDEILRCPKDHEWLAWAFPILAKPEFHRLTYTVGLENVDITVVGDAEMCARCGEGMAYGGFSYYSLCPECESELAEEAGRDCDPFFDD